MKAKRNFIEDKTAGHPSEGAVYPAFRGSAVAFKLSRLPHF